MNKLIDYLTPKLTNEVVPNGRIINKETYTKRKEVLNDRLKKTIDIIRVNYIDDIGKLVSELPRKVTTKRVLFRIHKKLISNSTTPRNFLIFSYILDLFVIMKQIRELEYFVDNSINYKTLEY